MTARRRKTGTGTADPTDPAADDATPVLHRAAIDVRWRDLDAFNHVNNANYLTYIEEARLLWMRSLPGSCVSDDVAPVLAASNLSYRRPIQWPAQIAVSLHVERVGTSSLTLAHRIVSISDATVVYCEGTTTMVWIDVRSGRPAALPAAVRDACALASPSSPSGPLPEA